MRLNWFQRTIQDYRRVPFEIESKQIIQLDRLQHAINYYRSKEDNGSDTYVETDIPSICRVFIITGIEHAMKVGFSSFTKAFRHYMDEQRIRTNIQYKSTFAYLQSAEQRALQDLYALVNEHLEDEHLSHYQPHYDIVVDDVVCFFIQNGCEEFTRISIPKASSMLNIRSV